MKLIDDTTAQQLRYPKVGDVVKKKENKAIIVCIRIISWFTCENFIAVKYYKNKKETKCEILKIHEWVTMASNSIRHGATLIPVKGKRGI